MSEVIVITSGKGGVGKTTTAANLGSALSLEKKKTVIVDADIGLRNLDCVMGLENRIVYDIVDVVEGTCRLKQALIKDKRFENLYLLPAAQTKDKNAISVEQMQTLCDNLRESFDYILIDCPAGIEQGFKNAIAGANRAIVVTNPEVSAVRDADRIIGLLEANEMEDIKLIIMMNRDDIEQLLAIPLIGLVPDDESIIVSTNKGEPAVLDPNSLAGKSYKEIARRVLGEEIEIHEFEEEVTIFDKIKKIFKNK